MDGAAYVAIVFHSDGTVALGPTPRSVDFGGAFTLAFLSGSGETLRAIDSKTIVILARTGAIHPFSRS